MLRWNVAGKYFHKFEHVKKWEDANGPIPKGFEIHHKDRDKANNQLSNLCIMSKADHLSLHKSKYATQRERLTQQQQGQGASSEDGRVI